MMDNLSNWIMATPPLLSGPTAEAEAGAELRCSTGLDRGGQSVPRLRRAVPVICWVGMFRWMTSDRPVIEIDACVGGRELTEPRLAPDGRSIAYVVSSDGEARLVIRSLDDASSPSAARIVTTGVAVRAGRGMGGGGWCWSADGTAVVYAGIDGDLWWQPLDGSAADRLTVHGPERAAQAPVASSDGRHIGYVIDQCEVWLVQLASRRGRARRAERIDDGSADFCFDPAIDPTSTIVVWQAWNVPHMPWDRSRLEQASIDRRATRRMRTEHATHAVPAAVQQPRFAPDGTPACVRDDTGWLNVWLGEAPLVAEPFEHAGPTWGLGQRSYAFEPSGRRAAFTRNEAGFGRLCVVDVASGRVEQIGRGVHGQLSWVAVEGINRIAAIRSGARTPTEIVVIDIDEPLPGAPTVTRRSTVDVSSDSTWDRDLLVEPEAVSVQADDGNTVHARLYRADVGDSASARMICWLHGGPTDQWQVTFMPRLAYWRAQGWHVLVPDHRGTTGHGRAYQQALNGRWGELDVADTAAVVRHAQRAGWASPERTVLMGASAGGFTVLGVLARHPDLAAAAVVSYPVSDLADLAERSHRFERHSTWSLVGPPGESADIEQRYRDRSPVWFAPNIRTPLLVFHGDADAVVPVKQSRVLAERIRAAGGQVELCIRPGEGHGFRQLHHQIDEFERTAAFLRRHVP
jgi:dipeptidyl aminopeptidase/acylaminoacyl peptidase